MKIHASRKLIAIFSAVVVLGAAGAFLFRTYAPAAVEPEFRWTMVDVNYTRLQGDAHLIQVRGGATMLIDAGYVGPARGRLIPFVRNHHVEHIDYAVVTHAHKDHYEGLSAIINAGISIGTVYFNMPVKSVCDKEIPWGCNYGDVLGYFALLHKQHIPIKPIRAGMQFNLGSGAVAKVLYAFDGIHTPVGRTDINDTSAIMMVKFEGYKMLFAADLNRRLGTYLAEYAKDRVKADILKVPHHGAESVAPNSFFAAVDPQYALVPTPVGVWCGKRGKRAREWFAHHKRIHLYVNGHSGNVTVDINSHKLTVTAQNETPLVCGE